MQPSVSMRKFYFTTVLFLVGYLAGCGNSGYSHCVSVSDESDYSGEWLKHSQAEVDSVMKNGECAAMEAAAGESDGPKRGKIRWAECLAGPDCNEAGDF